MGPSDRPARVEVDRAQDTIYTSGHRGIMPGMFSLLHKLGGRCRRYGASFSSCGLVVAGLLFAASLTPSLLPRHFLVQGLLSAIALAVGYGLGVLLAAVWQYLELPSPGGKLQRAGMGLAAAGVVIVAVVFLCSVTVWQNSIRQRMAMDPVSTAYPCRVALSALLGGAVLVAAGRTLGACWRWVHRNVNRLVPRRISYVVSTLLVVVGVVLVVNNVLARLALDAAEAVFLELDTAIEEQIAPPTSPTAAGGPESLIEWKTVGRQGRRFLGNGPTQQDIGQFWGQQARQPLRVYVGMAPHESMDQRAALAVAELKRVGGFDRSVLIVATPTGTGWLDPGAVDTLEYLHCGDTAIVSMQYSYLPSWMTILVDPARSRASAQALFNEVYGYWTQLPRGSRPRLYVHGLSLGAFGSESSADLFTIFEDPIQGGVWSGPPFPSPVWGRAIRARNADSPMWQPTFRDGSLLRFTTQRNALEAHGQRWGPMRFVYLQYASDPMTYFSPELLYRQPDWLIGQRGPDVSPYLRWWPIVTFLQVGFDLPMATSVPTGYGHNFAPQHYIDAWIAVTDPPNWSAEQTDRLKQWFVAK